MGALPESGLGKYAGFKKITKIIFNRLCRRLISATADSVRKIEHPGICVSPITAVLVNCRNFHSGKAKLMSKSIKSYRKPTHEEISACAQRIYEMEGRPEGKAVEHWLQAEAQLVAERKADAGLAITNTPLKSRPVQSGPPTWQKAPASQYLRRN
ncbi:MAG: hypothetical protein JWR19_2075 [Pedosphaera sp.]|nr:hypothetical protein [Pedosphaera sp.]